MKPDILRPLRHYENFHILLWLIKDSCWLMHWKVAGVIMIVPTLGVAIAIVVRSFNDNEFWINLAICLWIIANTYWMCCEFFWDEELRYYAFYPFVLGLLCVGWFYFKVFSQRTTIK